MLMQAHGCGAQASVRFKMFLNLQRLDEQRARIKREAAVRRGLAGPVEADKNTVCLAAFDVLDVNRLPAPRTDALQRWWVGYHLLRPLRWRLSAALRFGVCFFAPILGLPLIARIAVDRESAFLGHRPAIGLVDLGCVLLHELQFSKRPEKEVRTGVSLTAFVVPEKCA